MLVIPLSQHYTATMIIAVLQSRRVKIYDKTNFVLYPTEILCKSWRFLTITNTVLWLIWQSELPDDIIRIWSAALTSSCQVSAPNCSHNIAQLLDNFQFWYSSHRFFYMFITLHQTQVSRVANVKALVPSILYLQKHKINVNSQKYSCIAIIQGFIWLETRHISSGLTHHIQGVPGEKDQTSRECSLGQTIPI
jgi:hypothetical protein